MKHTIEAWVRANGCVEEPIIEELPVMVLDGTTVTRHTYAGGRNGSEVVLVVIHHGGHAWPGRHLASKELGIATGNVSGNDLAWAFFEKHPMP